MEDRNVPEVQMAEAWGVNPTDEMADALRAIVRIIRDSDVSDQQAIEMINEIALEALPRRAGE
jgi:hypothetical protein